MERLKNYLQFINEAEQLKNVLRTAWTSEGKQESTAEHSWRLALLAMVILEEYPRLDSLKVIKMALLHDIGEIREGDISAALRPDPGENIWRRKEEHPGSFRSSLRSWKKNIWICGRNIMKQSAKRHAW